MNEKQILEIINEMEVIKDLMAEGDAFLAGARFYQLQEKLSQYYRVAESKKRCEG